MNILSKIIESVTNNFHQTISDYHLQELFNQGAVNCFNHYINMVECIDQVSTNFSTSMYIEFINKIEEAFFNSSYRKKFCEVINYNNTRNLWTLFGNVVFKRRYYYDKHKKRKFYFVDEILMLPKSLRFDPFVCAKVCEVSSHESYAKAGRTVSELIGRRLKFYDDPDRYIINRATARNIVLRFKIPTIPYTLKQETPKKLYLMIDEHYVPSQFNGGTDFMVKAAVVFDNVVSVYKYKKKKDSKNRLRLTGKQVFASIDGDLQKQVMDYIYYTYDTDIIEEIVFMGDCHPWVKTFHHGFKFHPKLKITVSIDGYHYAQALEHICTTKYNHFLEPLREVIKNNDKQGFINICNVLKDYSPHRIDKIEEQQNYILNNWQYIQTYYHKVFVNCSMEAQVSHVFADIFTSRPRAYSKHGLRQLLKLRLLKANNIDIQKTYFQVLNKEYEHKNILDLSSFDKGSSSYSVPYWLKIRLDNISNNKVQLC